MLVQRANSGELGIRRQATWGMSDSAGDAYAISPNHDAWCVGGKRAVVYEFAGAWGE